MGEGDYLLDHTVSYLWYINLSLSPPVSDEWWSLTLGVLEILSSLDWSCHIARNKSLKGIRKCAGSG